MLLIFLALVFGLRLRGACSACFSLIGAPVVFHCTKALEASHKNSEAGVPVLNKLCTMHQMREVTFNFKESVDKQEEGRFFNLFFWVW